MWLSRGRGTAGAQDKESEFSILRRSQTVTSIIHTSENSSTTCFLCTHSMDLFAAPFRNVGLAPLDRPQVDLQQGPAERSARSLRAAHFFFFLKLALQKRSRPPPPQTYVLRFASFCELLRRPLTVSVERHRKNANSVFFVTESKVDISIWLCS